MIDALFIPVAALIFMLATGVFGVAGVVLFWTGAISVALVLSGFIVIIEYVCALIAKLLPFLFGGILAELRHIRSLAEYGS